MTDRNKFSQASKIPKPENQKDQSLRPTEPSLIELVPMRDGIKLYSEIFLPSLVWDTDSQNYTPVPVIFSRSPYPYTLPSINDSRPISRYLEAGYAIVFQLTRGQGPSEGRFRFFRDDINDGADAIDWISSQLWCDGNVGMEGSSYLGGTQLLAAKTKPKALKCIMPSAFVGNFTHSFPFTNGVPRKGPFLQWHLLVDAERLTDLEMPYGEMNIMDHPEWAAAFKKRPLIDAGDEILAGDKLTSWRAVICHPLDDEYWEDLHFSDDDLAGLKLPIFFTDGWYDTTVGPIEFFTRLEMIQHTSEDYYLLVGPWNHSQTYSTSQPGDYDGDRVLPDNGAIDLVGQRIKFFDRYLKGDKSVVVQEDRARIYITGSYGSNANTWLNLPTFPAPGTREKRLFLRSKGSARSSNSDGLLSWDAPTTLEPTDQYCYDPALPTKSVLEGFHDRSEVEMRDDVLTYSSEPFKRSLTILGNLTLVLHAASDGVDTDWFVLITEVFPDGASKSFHYAPSCIRARYHKGLDRECLLTPGKPEKFLISLGAAGHQIARGNKLRISIFSAAFPEYDTNTNTGNEAATDTESRIARQTIYHDYLRPSHVLIPVIEIDEYKERKLKYEN